MPADKFGIFLYIKFVLMYLSLDKTENVVYI